MEIFASLMDARLYLPESWCDDSERCDKAGIPEEEREFKTKIDLAYEMIVHQLELGTSFDYVGADGFYGNDCNLSRKVDLLGLTYMFDIHSNQRIYLEQPDLVLPERKSDRGPKPKRLTVTEESVKVSDYVSGLERDEWEEIKVRNTAKGSLKGLFHFSQVYIWNKDEDLIERRLLVVRKLKPNLVKMSNTHSPMQIWCSIPPRHWHICKLRGFLLNIASRRRNQSWEWMSSRPANG